ncbi:MAG TPA: rhodanese-like domain-containing protein [Coriobacteriia bacterium]
MSRSNIRTLIAAGAIAALALVAGCSLIPGGTPAKAPPAPPVSAGAKGTPAATATPAVSKSSSGTAVPVPSVPQQGIRVSSDIDGIELRDLQSRGALVVDLQAGDAFKKQHIQGAVSVPVPDFTRTAWGWPRERVVVLYDRTGAQSQAAQSWLERQGFTRIYHLFRGIDGYDDKLVGTAPMPIPPREPVLYYFYIDPSAIKPGQEFKYQQAALDDADRFANALKDEFGGNFEYHAYDVTTLEGQVRFLEFGGEAVPMFRLVDEDGHSQQYTGIGTIQTVRAHLKRAIDGYRNDTRP